jgi:imidazolonepropionase-like amidohydrolase
VGKAAEIGHGFEAVDWIESSDEDSACFAGKMRGDVEAVVHAVDEVDIYVSGRAEEYCVAGSETTGCVRCRVDEAEVGFDFDDAGGEAFALEIADEELAEEGSRDDLGGAGVEASWEEFEQARWLCAGRQSSCQ